jgi:1-acyl-sn-glycerol-3-phosphate acyltransferase
MASRLLRRARGITIELVLFVLVTVLSPVLLTGALLVDVVLWLARRKPFMAIRLVAMAWWFLLGEIRGFTTLGLIWLASGGHDSHKRRFRVYRLRWSWAAGHIGGVRVLFGLKFEVEGLDDAAPAPVMVFIRHASIIDNMLPDTVLGRTHGIALRYVLKRELQMLPTIDIGGHMVPTNFVRRGSGDTAKELENLRLLAVDLDPEEGILIYPEGTRWTAAKLARAQEIVRERQPEVAVYADRLVNLLPPRLGGPLALLEAAPELDVVFCGHVGLDGFEYISDIWRGGLVGTTVRIKFWREPAVSIPDDREGRIRWLYDNWQKMDDWIGAQSAHQSLIPGGSADQQPVDLRG